MEKTDEKLAILIEKLQDAGFAATPEVLDGAMRAIYWDGIVQLAGFCILIILLFMFVGLTIHSAMLRKDDFAFFGFLGSIGCTILLLIIGTSDNPWLKVFDPQAHLYQQIIQGIL